jgi:hypothetical protein
MKLMRRENQFVNGFESLNKEIKLDTKSNRESLNAVRRIR